MWQFYKFEVESVDKAPYPIKIGSTPVSNTAASIWETLFLSSFRIPTLQHFRAKMHLFGKLLHVLGEIVFSVHTETTVVVLIAGNMFNFVQTLYSETFSSNDGSIPI